MQIRGGGFISFVLGYMARMLALTLAAAAILVGALKLGEQVLPVSSFAKYGDVEYVIQKSLEQIPHIGEVVGQVFTALGVPAAVGADISLLNEITFGLILLAIFQLMQIYDAWVRSVVGSFLPQSKGAEILENIVCTLFLMAFSCVLAGIVNDIAAAYLRRLGYGGWLAAVIAAVVIVAGLLAVGKSAGARGGFFIDLLGKLLLSMLNVALIYTALLAISVMKPGTDPLTMLICTLTAVASILAVTIMGARSFANSFAK